MICSGGLSSTRTGKGGRFASRYNLTKLVYYEVYASVEDAILREKQIKGGSRQKKIDLVKRDESGLK